MKFALFGNTYQAKKSAHVERLLSILSQHNAEVHICREFYQFLTNDLKISIRHAGVFDGNNFEADMILSIGGDGTFLKAASRVGSRNIPILGINTGRLGFLADVSPEEMEDTFNDIYNGNYRIEDRSVLQVSCKEQELKGYPFGLNEIAVLKRDSSSMISIHTAINGAYLTTYQADGLVIVRNMLQGIQHTIEPLLASGLELIGKVIFGVWIVPAVGYTAVCFCEPVTWVICFVFILGALYRCRGELKDKE